jgi:hypothetical protein
MIGERALKMVNEIDIALNRIGEGLNRAQPPYTGKLILTWVDEGGVRKVPVIKKMMKTKSSKVLLQAVPNTQLVKRAARRSSFSINYEYVKDLLSEAEYLMHMRKTINIKIRQVQHWELMYCREHETRVGLMLGKVSEIHDDIEENLRNRKTRKLKTEEIDSGDVETIVMQTKATVRKSKSRGIKVNQLGSEEE